MTLPFLHTIRQPASRVNYTRVLTASGVRPESGGSLVVSAESPHDDASLGLVEGPEKGHAGVVATMGTHWEVRDGPVLEVRLGNRLDEVLDPGLTYHRQPPHLFE